MSPSACLVAALHVALLLGALVARSARSDEPGSHRAGPTPEAGLVAGNRTFACDLLRLVAAKPGNAFFSPHSITSALALARAGAAGETATQMDAVLHLPPQAPAAYRALVTALTTIPEIEEYSEKGPQKTPAYGLSIANGLFVRKGFALVEAFRATVADDFKAELRELDFAKGSEARDAINGWVAQKTKDRIKDIVPAGLPPSDTRLLLANAIHFKAQWAEPFPESATADGPFTVSPGKDVVAKRMKRRDRMAYAETPTAQWLEILYRGGDTSMIVILPKSKDGIDGLVTSLTGDAVATAVATLATQRVALELPKFSFTATLDVAVPLKALGMTAAFEPTKADFSGIAADKLFVGAVLHKAFVAVDEKGTEAAAATVVRMTLSAAPAENAPIPFVVDHPFLFLIRHRVTGEILFVGRVQDPTAGS